MSISYLLKIVAGIVLGLVVPQTAAAQGEREAERVWELAIKAKGGRGSLYKVHNILGESTSEARATSGRTYKRTRVSLAVLPDKIWSYTDERPEVFGETAVMLDYENMVEYFSVNGREKVIASPIPARRHDMKAYQNSAIFYLMEPKWLKPRIVGMTSASIDGGRVFIVQTTVDGRRVDFALSQASYLPMKISLYDTGSDGVTRRNEMRLSNYVEVDGIKVPRTTTYNKQGVENLTIRFNVDYDPLIFTRSPTTLTPDAWQGKGRG